jgi:hypothetical protein
VERVNITFSYPIGYDWKPRLYYVTQETGQKSDAEIAPTVENHKERCIVKYSRNTNIRGETIRLEW